LTNAPKVLLARGARGELVRRAQLALIAGGFDPNGADGVFGRRTDEALRAFQQAHALEPTGRVDAETWRRLVGGAPPSAFERSLQVTAAFEGHGFSVAQGNWDGAGITWGIVGFTLLHGAIPQIILEILRRHPARLDEAFGSNAGRLIDVMRSSRAAQIEFANSISLAGKTALQAPWRAGFARLGEMPEVQALQLDHADRAYGQPSAATARALGLKSELGRALAFDIHIQNGGVKPGARRAIRAAIADQPITAEQQLRVIVAHAVADASHQFREDVRARKLTFAVGTGRVHEETFVLANWGLHESPADDVVDAGLRAAATRAPRTRRQPRWRPPPHRRSRPG
jgi:hypothetical protein